MTKRAKRVTVTFLRIAICAAALWLVVQGVTYYDHVHLATGEVLVGDVIAAGPEGVEFRHADGAVTTLPVSRISADEDGSPRIAYGLRGAWRHSNKWMLLLALLVHFPVVFPQALRFKWLLGAQDIHLSYWECTKLSFAGNFLNFATPLGSHAGDAFKAYFASLHTDRKTEAVTTVVLDRIIGLASLLLVAGLITLFASRQGKLAVLQPYVLGMLAATVVGLVLYFWPAVQWRSLMESWSQRVPSLGHYRRIDQAARTLFSRKLLLVAAVAVTVILQALAMSAYTVTAVAVGMEADPANVVEYFAYFYTGTLVQALPGPPQGLGTVELAYRYFFSAYGSPSQIVTMALVIRVVVLVCALPGLLVTLTGGYRPREMAGTATEKALSQPAVQNPVL